LPVGNCRGAFYRVIWNVKGENILISFRYATYVAVHDTNLLKGLATPTSQDVVIQFDGSSPLKR
jgi:hypothetical protein